MKNRLFPFGLLLMCLAFVVACSGPLSKKSDPTADKDEIRMDESGNYKNTAIIMGKITGQKQLTQPLLVIAYPLNSSGEKRANRFEHVVLDRLGEYMLYVPAGAYKLYTVVDFNGDNRFQPNEGSGMFGKGRTITIQEGDLVTGIDIESASEPRGEARFPETIGISFDFHSIEYRGKNGRVVKIYDAIFSTKNAAAGLWSPNDFLRTFGANIYLTSEYDPTKIPVLFVHGSSGSPQDWLPFFIRLDKNRFQPWFFYYPSGMRLTLSSAILSEKLTELQERFGFDSICLVAHSMGGFVTQALLTDPEHEKAIRTIKLYFTLATPWSGFESADTAVATSPVVAPSWNDIGSRSVFIKKLLRKTLPATIPHYLFFGKNDSVSGGKALDQRIFENATGRFGFDVDHQTILSDKTVFQTFEKILTDHFSAL